MQFAILNIWRILRNYDDCYFYFSSVNLLFPAKNQHQIEYPSLEPRKLVKHDTLSILFPPDDRLDSIVDDIECDKGSTCVSETTTDPDYRYKGTHLKPKLLSRDQLNNLVRNLGLSKEKSELLASRLRENNLLEHNVEVSFMHYIRATINNTMLTKLVLKNGG